MVIGVGQIRIVDHCFLVAYLGIWDRIVGLNMIQHTLDIQVILCKDGRSLVYGFATAVEHSTQHVLRDGSAQDVARELAKSILCIDAGCTFEYLYTQIDQTQHWDKILQGYF